MKVNCSVSRITILSRGPSKFPNWHLVNRPFHRYDSHTEFIRFKEYYGMPKGHSFDQYLGALFEQKENFTVYFSGKGGHYYVQTRYNDFFPINYTLFLGKLKEKLARKARLNTARVYRIVLMPLGIPKYSHNSWSGIIFEVLLTVWRHHDDPFISKRI